VTNWYVLKYSDLKKCSPNRFEMSILNVFSSDIVAIKQSILMISRFLTTGGSNLNPLGLYCWYAMLSGVKL
jgi:hypothetical protein